MCLKGTHIPILTDDQIEEKYAHAAPPIRSFTRTYLDVK